MSRYNNYCYNCDKSQNVYTDIAYDWDDEDPTQLLKVICSECHKVMEVIYPDDEAFSEYLSY